MAGEISLTVACPVCGVAVATRTLVRKGDARAIDGNFDRDPGQHVHYDDDVQVQCSNRHSLRVTSRILVARER